MDVAVTLMLWTYFTLGFVFFFAPVYIAACLFAADHRIAFQKLNHRFFRGFFWLLQTAVPGLAVEIDGRISGLESCVVVSNHRSYLDPLIMIACFEKQSTIVKKDFFRVPIFGWVIRAAGYIPSEGNGRLASLLMSRIEWMHDYLAGGGVLFVFPEGTRSRTGRIGQFNKGAFKIARSCETPIEVLCITNTDKLFTPGRFLFNTCVKNRIQVRRVGRISARDVGRLPVDQMMAGVREIMENHLDLNSGNNREHPDR
ncbi:MAG: 1-acyl-sn-glycerol-3-phosphate acyltransferase [Desulfobacteraceae bacterium]|nr:1-acyl-sn-glycerol-3-phosphate acyltransferase [Desulfobacteraceae bacterium]